jgi:alpha-galactosidase
MTIINNNPESIFDVKLRSDTNNICIYDVYFKSDLPCTPSRITVEFNIPYIEAFSLWNAQCGSVWNEKSGTIRNILPDWRPQHQVSSSRLASGIPIQSVISQDGRNVFTISVNDAKTPIEISTGTEEFNKSCLCRIVFFTIPVGKTAEYRTQIIIDKRRIPFYEAIQEAAERMRTGKQSVPQYARFPMYSTWYNYHQDINDDKLIEECKKAYELGMRSIIVDDGWQTENNGGGYAYCGDWRVCKSKIKDMRAFIDAIHNIGMKVILWYSVPFIGKNSDIWAEFKGKYLDNEENEWNCLDPRFPEVREYLAGLYEKAALEWKLDGFKLDFIDSFELTEYSDKTGAGRDFESLEDAIECMLGDITERLKKINPDVLLEFRQSYIGPVITQYGNMIRVGDCALDAFINRVGILDLRMTSGRAAVHSDMITWNNNDTNESVAKQLIAVLFGVPQISVRLDEITAEHYEVLKFWLNFWMENQEILLDGNLKIYNPEANYSMAEAELNNRKICVCYGRNIVECSGDDFIVVNGTGEDFIVVRATGDFKYTILDCKGTCIESGQRHIDDIAQFDVSQSGVLLLEASGNKD